MPNPAQHTVFRFRLRSLLVITAGAAVVLALARPWLEWLDGFQWGHLIALLVVMAAGAGGTLVYLILARRSIGLRCGKLLLRLPIPAAPGMRELEYGLIASGLVFGIVYFFFLGDPTNRDDAGVIIVPAVTFPLLLWCSIRLARHGLALWSEGYDAAVEFCEGGVVLANRLYAWDSPRLRAIRWTASGEAIELDVERYLLAAPVPPATVPVPPHQRAAVKAILTRCPSMGAVAAPCT